MGLNYTDGCVNFRDFGAYINLILGKDLLPEGKFYRGGSIDHIDQHAEIEHVKSIVNLRNRMDYQPFEVNYYHFPMQNKVEKYDTSQKEVRKWLNIIMQLFEDQSLQYPVLIHCLSGKDRTGIVVCALLMIMGVQVDAIEEEYLLSEGEVKLSWIRQAMEGMWDMENYFSRVDLDKVRKNLLG
ncbi:tyrosine-protein phosphatase [Limibacter armeniacum]|uniref:tyrosine-protein phosphatase n=1 Tax=Limibacter armeniacum TaxID=466084 RepID=UPI002FE5441F